MYVNKNNLYKKQSVLFYYNYLVFFSNYFPLLYLISWSIWACCEAQQGLHPGRHCAFAPVKLILMKKPRSSAVNFHYQIERGSIDMSENNDELDEYLCK